MEGVGEGGLDSKMPGGPSNSADFGPPTTRGLENRPKHRETDEGKSSGHPCPSTPPSASGEAFQPCDQGPGPGEARTRSEKLKEVARSQRSLTSRREGRNLNLLKRKYLRLRGAPGLHFPVFPRGTRAAAPPPGRKYPLQP